MTTRPDHRPEAAACVAALVAAAASARYALEQLSGPHAAGWFPIAVLAWLALAVTAVWTLVLGAVVTIGRVRGALRPRPGRGGRAPSTPGWEWAVLDAETSARLGDAWTEDYRAADAWMAGPGMAQRPAGDPRTQEMPAVRAEDGHPADEPSADRDDLLMGEGWRLAARYGSWSRNRWSL